MPKRLATVLSSADVASRYSGIAMRFSIGMSAHISVLPCHGSAHTCKYHQNMHQLSRRFFLNTLSGECGSVYSYHNCACGPNHACRSWEQSRTAVATCRRHCLSAFSLSCSSASMSCSTWSTSIRLLCTGVC